VIEALSGRVQSLEDSRSANAVTARHNEPKTSSVQAREKKQISADKKNPANQSKK
jgi:hypothetical protein